MPVPVLVQNERPGPAVFTDELTKQHIEWQGKGDPSGEDVQYVPEEIATTNVNFIKAVTRGIFKIVQADEATLAKITEQADAYRARNQGQEEAAEASLDRNSERTLMVASIDDKGKATEIPVSMGPELPNQS